MKTRMKTKIIYKNETGKIVKVEDTMFGGTSYHLEDSNGNYVKRIYVPFKVSNFL